MTCLRVLVVVIVTGVVWALPAGAQAPVMPGPPMILPEAAVPTVPVANDVPGSPAGIADQAGGVETGIKRDPFWPVGYAPKITRKVVAGGVVSRGSVPVASTPVAPVVPGVTQWDEARRKLDIRGISLLGSDKTTGRPKYMAMVAGHLVEDGNIVTAEYEGRMYRWKVVGISSAGISFQKLDVRSE